jgi:hypothetical protein
VKCGFSTDVSRNDDSAVKLTEDEKMSGTFYRLLECSYPTCDSALEVCGVWSVDHLLDQYFTRPEEEVVERKGTFLDTPKGLEAARKYICQFDTKNNIIVMCNIVENELYKLKEKRNKRLTEEIV